MNQPLYHVLIGNCEASLSAIWTTLLSHINQDRFDLKYTTRSQLKLLEEECSRQEFDLCLLALENIPTSTPAAATTIADMAIAEADPRTRARPHTQAAAPEKLDGVEILAYR